MFAEFAKLRALRTFAHYVPLRLWALRALRTFGPYTPSALITFIPYTPSRLKYLTHAPYLRVLCDFFKRFPRFICTS